MSTAALPKAIQRQLDEAAQIERAIAGQAVSEVEQVEAPAPSNDPAPEVVAPAPQPAVETPSQPAAEIEKRPNDDAVYWRKRFDTVQGMLNAESQQRKELSQRLDEMQRQIEQQRKPEKPRDPLISAKDEEAFGSDLIDLARRAAREEFGYLAGSLIADIRKELNPVREQVGKVAERQVVSEQDRFYQTLEGMVPDWEQINADTRWLEWLAEVDPLLGAPRQTALESAHGALDAQRVAALFNTWKNQFAPKQKGPSPALERQVSPQKTGGGATPAPAAKIWTRADYERAFDPRLTRSMGAAEIAQMQAEADRAHQEGRIQW